MLASLRALLYPSKVANLRGASFSHLLTILAALLCVTAGSSSATTSQIKRRAKLPRARKLDQGIKWQRDPATGELRLAPANSKSSGSEASETAAPLIQVVAKMVSVTCSVSTPDGIAVPGLARS